MADVAMAVSYSALESRIGKRLAETTERLEAMHYESQHISPKEFYEYMTGETPTGDTITILDVLDNDYLLIHEVVEMSELKKKGFPIDDQTVMVAYPTTYETHIVATQHELNYALDKGDYAWLRVRLDHAKSWLADPEMPQHLVEEYTALVKHFSKSLRNRK